MPALQTDNAARLGQGNALHNPHGPCVLARPVCERMGHAGTKTLPPIYGGIVVRLQQFGIFVRKRLGSQSPDLCAKLIRGNVS